MTFTVRDANGQPVSGDIQVDAGMRAYADELGGSITDDDTGAVVHQAKEN